MRGYSFVLLHCLHTSFKWLRTKLVLSSDEEGGASDHGDGDSSSSSQTGSSDSGVCNGDGVESGESGDGGGWGLELPRFDIEDEESGGERVIVVERETRESDIEDTVEDSMEEVLEGFYLKEEDKKDQAFLVGKNLRGSRGCHSLWCVRCNRGRRDVGPVSRGWRD